MQSSLLQIFKLRVAVTVLITLISLTAVQGNPSTQVWVRRAADPAAAQNYRRPGLLRAGLRRFTSQLARVVPQPLKVLPRRITQPIEDFKIPESVKRRVDQIRAQMQRLARVRFNHGITDPAQIEPVLTRLSVLVKRIYGYYLYRDPANHALKAGFANRGDLVILYENSPSQFYEELKRELNLNSLPADFPGYILEIYMGYPMGNIVIPNFPINATLEEIIPYDDLLLNLPDGQVKTSYHHRVPASRVLARALDLANIYKVNGIIHTCIHAAIRLALGTTVPDGNAVFLLGKPSYDAIKNLDVGNGTTYLEQLHIFDQPHYDATQTLF